MVRFRLRSLVVVTTTACIAIGLYVRTRPVPFRRTLSVRFRLPREKSYANFDGITVRLDWDNSYNEEYRDYRPFGSLDEVKTNQNGRVVFYTPGGRYGITTEMERRFALFVSQLDGDFDFQSPHDGTELVRSFPSEIKERIDEYP